MTDKPTRYVTIRTAYEFTCEECGRDNFRHACHVESDPETLAEMREELGIESWEAGEWVMPPRTVICEFCGTEFIPRDDRAEDEDDEEGDE